MSLLDEMLGKIGALPEAKKKEFAATIMQATAGMKWVPSPGVQTEAFFSLADILLYGGQGGGGKSDLGLGLSFSSHRRSLILRRKYVDLTALVERALEINGTRDGFNGQPPPKLRTTDGRLIHFGANQHLGDEQSWQGQPYDLKVFDEAVQFLELQVRFHLGWLRSTEAGQRCRALLATNPPLTADGQWIIGMFRPWLDITHPSPAKPGELRWFVTDPDGKDLEVPSASPIELDGKTLIPQSRTFIPAKLSDNPFLVNTGYQAQLDGLPEPLRSAVRDGNFMAARQDAVNQVIPTEWVLAAQSRWQPDGFRHWAQTAIGYDPAGGGKDGADIAPRHGPWYAEITEVQGPQTASGTYMAGEITKIRRDASPVVIDVGGGYAGASIERFNDNGIVFVRFNGAGTTTERALNINVRFYNNRAKVWWRFREALDPDQDGGSTIALPPDPLLRADLTTPTWELRSGEILVETKEKIMARLGRSPGRGDAVVMALSEGDAAKRKQMSSRAGGRNPVVVMKAPKTRR